MTTLTLKDLEQRIALLEAQGERLEAQNERIIENIGGMKTQIANNRTSFDNFVDYAYEHFGTNGLFAGANIITRNEIDKDEVTK